VGWINQKGGSEMSDTPRTEKLAKFRYGRVDERFVEEVECAKLERELNEARDLARKLRDALIKHHKFCAGFSVGGYNSSFSKMQREAERIITKAEGLI
jgi:hypothetical protein